MNDTWRRIADERNGALANDVPCGFVEVFDRRLAIYPRQHEAREECGGARLDTGAEFGGEVAEPIG